MAEPKADAPPCGRSARSCESVAFSGSLGAEAAGGTCHLTASNRLRLLQ
jgi:hypothetical protein